MSASAAATPPLTQSLSASLSTGASPSVSASSLVEGEIPPAAQQASAAADGSAALGRSVGGVVGGVLVLTGAVAAFMYIRGGRGAAGVATAPATLLAQQPKHVHMSMLQLLGGGKPAPTAVGAVDAAAGDGFITNNPMMQAGFGRV